MKKINFLIILILGLSFVSIPNHVNALMTFEDLKQYGLDTSNAYVAKDGTVKGWTEDFSNAKSAAIEPVPNTILINLTNNIVIGRDQ